MRLAAFELWQALMLETEHMRYLYHLWAYTAQSFIVLLHYVSVYPCQYRLALIYFSWSNRSYLPVLHSCPNRSSCNLRPLYVNRSIIVISRFQDLQAGPPIELLHRARFDLPPLCLCCISHILCFCPPDRLLSFALSFAFAVLPFFAFSFFTSLALSSLICFASFLFSFASSFLLCLFCFFIWFFPCSLPAHF